MPLASETEIQASYADRGIAHDYVDRRFASELMRLLHGRQVESVNRLMREHCPARALEIAPGPGRITRDVEPARELVCLEFNQAMIEVGKPACERVTQWVRGNAFALPFGREFSLVYSFRFIRHFHRDDRHRLYDQIHKVLEPGGHLIMDAVNARVSAPLRAANPEAYPIYDKLYRDEAELRTELEAAGFTAVQVDPVQRWFSLQYRAQLLLGPRSVWACRGTIRLLERLRRGPSLEWIVICRRA